MRKILIFILIALPLVLIPLVFINQRVRLFPKAEEKTANIVVDADLEQGALLPIWQALAQGGEEKYPFPAVIDEISTLKPKYIRIDHIYDFYDVVKKENGQLIYSWQDLDQQIDQILQAGALPFLCLSYMPPAISQAGQIIDAPENWPDWQEVVRATIQHFSGKNERNLDNIIYEVWNEPDLFGDWRVGGEKDYRLLYRYAAQGAKETTNTNAFKIGGPGVTAPYPNWINGFLDYVIQNNLRLDFYSWHRYSQNPDDFLKDIDNIDNWLFTNGGYSLDKYLTEWAPTSEKSPINDSDFSASHLIATIRKLIQRVDLAFTFEISGNWGILDKPRETALELLNNMTGNRLSLTGEGSFVSGFAGKDANKIKIILVNLDQKSQHFELVPLSVINLENGRYFYREIWLSGKTINISENITNGFFSKEIPLDPNQAVQIELEKI